MTVEDFIKQFAEITKKCYDETFGAGEWNKLSEKGRHDCIMHFAEQFRNGLRK